MVDGANPSFIKSLKLQIGEDPDYDKIIAKYKEKFGYGTQDMRIVPVNFKSEHNPDRFDKLITAIRTGVDNDGALDKGSTSFNQ